MLWLGRHSCYVKIIEAKYNIQGQLKNYCWMEFQGNFLTLRVNHMWALFLEEILKEEETEKKLKVADYLYLNTSMKYLVSTACKILFEN